MKLAYYPLLLSILFSLSVSAQTDNVGSGRAIEFDGNNDYIDLGNIYDNLSLPITVSAWVNIDPSKSSSNPIFTSQDNAEIYNGFWFFVSTSNILMEIGDGTGSNNPAFRRGKVVNINIPSGQWHHICGVMRSPTDIDIYVNGINVGGEDSGDSNLPMNSNFPNDVAQIGHHLSNGIHYWFGGMLDDVRVYNTALTQTQVRETMCKKLAGNETGLIGYWDFNETSGNFITDKSSNGFHGELKNSPLRKFSGAPIGDESVFLYPGNWSSAELVMNENSNQVTVSDVSANAAGAHIYTIRSMPSQLTGIDVNSATPPYFGVFIADRLSGRTFDMEYSQACELVFRKDNSESTWTSGVLENIINRIEFIKSGGAEDININLGPDEELCPFTTHVLKPVNNPAGYTFLWQDGSTGPTFSASTYGTYWVNVKKGCSFDRDTITFTRLASEFSIDLGEDQVVCPLEPSVLQPLNNPAGHSFVWNNNSNQSTLLVTDYGKYWVTVENECGVASDTIRFNRPEYTEIKIPNVITPNNDNFNEFFEIENALLGSTIEVFNRWGKKVYRADNYQNRWNADGLPAGIYFYFIRHDCIEEKKGWLSVIR